MPSKAADRASFHPPIQLTLQPSHQAVVVIFFVVAEDPIFHYSHAESLLLCAKPSCAKKKLLFRLHHRPDPKLPRIICCRYCSSRKTHVLLTLAVERLPCDRNPIVFAADPVPPSASSEQARPTLEGDLVGGQPGSAEACDPTSSMLQLSSRIPNQTVAPKCGRWCCDEPPIRNT